MCFIRTEIRMCLSLCMDGRKKERERNKKSVCVCKKKSVYVAHVHRHALNRYIVSNVNGRYSELGT